MQKEMSNSKYPFCMESNMSPGQCLNRIFLGGLCNSLETEPHKQNLLPSVSVEDIKILPNYPEDEKCTYSNDTKPDKCITFASHKESLNRENQLNTGIIQKVTTNSWTSVNLCKRQLIEVPETILTMNNIVNLYLANNEIAILPDRFFEYFPLLRWLDLRYNRLTHLPNITPDGHHELRCLLIEGNEIRILPLQLGFMHKLHGLNIFNNPIEFPSSDIIMKGTREILKYLLNTYIQQNQVRDDSSSIESSEENVKEDNSPFEILHHDDQHEETCKTKNNEPKQNSKIHEKHVLTSDEIAQQAREVLHKLALSKNNMKIQKILQQKKDQESLKKFQKNYKEKQEQQSNLNIEVPDVVSTAPFAAAPDCMKMLSRKDIAKAPEESQPLPDVVLHKTKMQPQKLREVKMEELEEKIKSHYLRMHNRRKQAHNSVLEEVTAMKKDLDEAKHLQNQLEIHRQDLEYRFKAFTADISLVKPLNTLGKSI